MQTVEDQIIRDIEINAPIDRVWAAITQPEHLGAWFGDAGATVDFRVGGELMLEWKEYGKGWAVIEAIDEPIRFAFRWAFSGNEKPVPGNSTLVEFTLEDAGKATKLRVVESGFTKLDVTPEEQAKAVTGNTEGWQVEIDELKAYVEKLVA